LAIEDDDDTRTFMLQALAAEGYDVRGAPHGVAALDVLRAWQPDLILLDLRMPVMSGREFAEAYQETAGPHAPIVLLTAARDPAETAAEMAAAGSLAKPFDLFELLNVVAAHAKRSPGSSNGAQSN
jgi:DNA-binding response OmpR family regulator